VSESGQRAERARAILAAAGIDAVVTAAGQQGEIASVRADHAALPAIAAQATAIRGLGFRYVALDIGAEPESASD